MCWCICEKNALDEQAVDRLGNKLLTGNGYLGYRGTLEEYSKAQKTATILSGIYDQVGSLWREPVNAPNGLAVQLFYQGRPLHALTSATCCHSQSLDLQHAVHYRRTVFQTEDGKKVAVHARRFASLDRLHLLCLEYTLQSTEDIELTVRAGIDSDVWDLNGPHLEEINAACQEGILSVSAVTHAQRLPITVAAITQMHAHDQPVEMKFTATVPAPSAYYESQVHVTPLNTIVLHQFAAVYSGQDGPDPLALARMECSRAALEGFEALFQKHSALWEARWQACDVTIKGDEEAQLALRFSMYHLLAIAPLHSDKVSIPARGLSGQVYKGAYFWDTEIFMLPFFNTAFPAISRNLLRYRYHTLDGARRKAREYGFRGAFYAWESQDSGDDACTLFNVTDVFTNRPMRTYFRDKQVHISGDIVYALWAYYTASGDFSIFIDGGAEIVFECARFYLSYAYYSPTRKRYEILDVTGPDEYHERVNNNAFTNLLVAHTLDVCLRVYLLMKAQAPDALAELIERIDFQDDLECCLEMREKLYRPTPDPKTKIIPQFDGYHQLEDVPLKDLLARKLHPHEYLGGGNGLATTTQILKQADVVLALFLFNQRYPKEVKAANWAFYEPRTEHGSSLSACSYAMIAAQIGKADWAYPYFMKTATIDITGEGKQYVGTLYIGGTHPAGNGGAWMAAVLGHCGIQAGEDGLSIDPHLPAHWQEVSVPLTYRGQRLRVTINQEGVIVKALQPLTTPLKITIGGQEPVWDGEHDQAAATLERQAV